MALNTGSAPLLLLLMMMMILGQALAQTASYGLCKNGRLSKDVNSHGYHLCCHKECDACSAFSADAFSHHDFLGDDGLLCNALYDPAGRKYSLSAEERELNGRKCLHDKDTGCLVEEELCAYGLLARSANNNGNKRFCCAADCGDQCTLKTHFCNAVGVKAQQGLGKPHCCEGTASNQVDCLHDHDTGCFLSETSIVRQRVEAHEAAVRGAAAAAEAAAEAERIEQRMRARPEGDGWAVGRPDAPKTWWDDPNEGGSEGDEKYPEQWHDDHDVPAAQVNTGADSELPDALLAWEPIHGFFVLAVAAIFAVLFWLP